jgi:hypothetical protein
MTGHAVHSALEGDVQVVDIVVKGPGVARLTRLTDRGDIEAALGVLEARRGRPRREAVDETSTERDPAAAGGAGSGD